MEKIKSLTRVLTDINYKATIRLVVHAGRKAKDQVKAFRESGNGCILLMAVPLCQQADVWLGGLSEYDENGRKIDLHEYVIARTIAPGGSHTIQWKDPGDGHIEPVNCLAYATMKLAYLSHLIKDDIPDRDHDEVAQTTDYYTEANGYSNHRGAVCTTIYYADQPLMRFYVVFSGATEDEDLRCALETANQLCCHLSMCDPHFLFVLRTVDGVVEDGADSLESDQKEVV